MFDFLIGVAASVVAAAVITSFIWFKTRAVFSWKTLQVFGPLSRRMKENGLSNIYFSRADYYTERDNQNISDYVATASNEIVYVGYWLAQGSELKHIDDAFCAMVKKGIVVELILLDPQMPVGLRHFLADFLAIPEEQMTQRVLATWDRMLKARNGLPGEKKTKFVLRKHSCLLSCSAFIFDENGPMAKILLDFKFFGLGRDHSMGMEFVDACSGSVPLRRFTRSFDEVRKASQIVW